jgi:myosin protein heavy chain
VNEKLQQFFNHHMFVLEQEEYAREGIQWQFIDFGLDLAACIELIEKPMGIISMLDEECIVPKATDLTLAQKLADKHLGKHPNFHKPKPPKGKQAEAHFAMAHYAGMVRYNVLNWLEKNKDPLNDTCVTVFKNQKGNPLLLTIWSDYQTQEEAAAVEKAGGARKKGKSGSMMTVSMKYREGLNNLMGMLNATHPSFVRCLIPNELKKSGLLDASLVMNQLTCNGVLEGIRICRKGFPNRTVHEDFKQRYALLAPDAVASAGDPKEASDGILKTLVKKNKIDKDAFRVGHTKVFFKAGILAHMEDLRDEQLTGVMIGIQTNIRSYCGQLEYDRRQSALDAYSTVQNNIRNWAVLRSWPWYGIYGYLRPMLNRGAEEIAKLQKLIEEGNVILGESHEKTKALEGQLAEVEKKLATLQQEMEDRNQNANMSKDKAAQLETDVRALQTQVDDLNGVVGGMEDKNGEAQRACTALQAETSELKNQRAELEKKSGDIENERKEREANIAQMEADGAKAEETIARLSRETKDLTSNNWRLKDDMEAAEAKAHKLERDQASAGRKTEDVEDLLSREQRNKNEIEKANKNLEEELKQATEKLEQLQAQVEEADAQMRQKDQDCRVAVERLRDEAVKVSRLEQQLIDLSVAFTSYGR